MMTITQQEAVDFLAYVKRCRETGLGYGRMMQIISFEWHSHDPRGALCVHTAVGLLSEENRRDYEKLKQIDPLFSGEGPGQRVDQAASIIDNLLVLFEIYGKDYLVISEALNHIAEIRRENPGHPITVSLANYMREKGLIE